MKPNLTPVDEMRSIFGGKAPVHQVIPEAALRPPDVSHIITEDTSAEARMKGVKIADEAGKGRRERHAAMVYTRYNKILIYARNAVLLALSAGGLYHASEATKPTQNSSQVMKVDGNKAVVRSIEDRGPGELASISNHDRPTSSGTGGEEDSLVNSRGETK